MLASQNKVFYEQSQKKLARQRKIWQEKCSKLKKKNRNRVVEMSLRSATYRRLNNCCDSDEIEISPQI